MKPTIENWSTGLSERGPIYPGVGWEVWMVIAAALFCLFFLIWKLVSENRRYGRVAKQLTASSSSHGDTNQQEEHNDG